MNLLASPVAPAALPRRDPSSPAAAAGAFFSRLRRLAALALLAAGVAVSPVPAEAAELVPEIRAARAYRGGSDVTLLEAAWYGRAPRWMRAMRLEYAAGVIGDDDRRHAFVFAGPVWRLGVPRRRVFAEASIGPTLLTGSTVSGREIGGRFHFRSALAIGTTLGARDNIRIAVRISHISNGGLRDDNPGLDFVGLSFSGGFSGRAHRAPRGPLFTTTKR